MEVGRLVALWRYPVKSMGAEALDTAEVGWHGLAGDRRWAFVRDGLERSNFPWLTIREDASLWAHVPRFADREDPEGSATVVTTPSGDEVDVADPALAQRLGARLMKLNRGTFDIAPLSLITTQTVAAVGAGAGRDLEPRRFRPNLLVEAASAEPFAEDTWVGATVRIGGMRMRVDQRDKRCVLINVDPATGERDPAVLRTVAQQRDARAGVYGATVECGRVAVGDAVVLERP